MIFPVPKPVPRERKPPKRLQAKASLKRGGFLNRKTRISAKRAKERRGPWRSPAYRAWIRTHRCIGITEHIPHDCDAWKGIEASHTGEDKGGSMKASDRSCLPKCSCLHRQWEQRKGAFAQWTRLRRQEWAAPMAARFFTEWSEAQERSAA